MKIISVKYLSKSNDGVNITFEDETTFQIPTQKQRYQYTDALAEWLKVEGNVIAPWKTQEELKKEADEKVKQETKTQKAKELNELVINHNTVFYDANQESIGNMGTVISIANATFNKAISVGIEGNVMTLTDAYNYVYKEQTVAWKGADNKGHTIQLESLVEASQKAMTKKAEILFKY